MFTMFTVKRAAGLRPPSRTTGSELAKFAKFALATRGRASVPFQKSQKSHSHRASGRARACARGCPNYRSENEPLPCWHELMAVGQENLAAALGGKPTLEFGH